MSVERDRARPRRGLRGATRAAVPVRPRRAIRRPSLAAQIAVNVLAALVVVSLVQAFVVRVHSVTSGSMENTLAVSDRVLSSDLPYLAHGPTRGDIVIFGHGETWSDARLPSSSDPVTASARLFGDLTGIGVSNTEYTVKRVIGTPGDVVACCDSEGRVTINEEPIEEPYLFENPTFVTGAFDCASSPRSARCFGPITVPAASYFVLGDHRANSADSVAACRGDAAPPDCARFVPAVRITGKVIARAWPPGPVS